MRILYQHHYKPATVLMTAFCVLLATSCSGQSLSTDIRLNQLGFYPGEQKIAVVANSAGGEFYIATPDLKKRLFSGTLSEVRQSAFSNKTTRVADFSAFRKKGRYVLLVPALGHSYTFEIKTNIYQNLALAALKAFYYQRASTPLLEAQAGAWQRPAGHPDRQVLVHASAADAQRPEGTVIASPGGWYDAGDYNKYIVNSGITMGTLLSLYEDFPAELKKVKTNIPESANASPDLLDEICWNLRWMLTMQDPGDGGVYHKCTTAEFEGFVKPSEAHDTRYVVQKSSAAALNFAAVMAQSSRVFGAYARQFPGLADSCLTAALKAWAWARKNPGLLYEQDKLNAQFDPDINTGAYGDRQLSDEWLWAAIELYITTFDEKYWNAIELLPSEKLRIQSWNEVSNMGYFTLLRHRNHLPAKAQAQLPELERVFLAFAENLIGKTGAQAYQAPMENDIKNYVWGSTAVCANQAIVLIYAYRLSGKKEFFRQALSNLDYLLGRNATGYSFVTGFGSKTPKHPHHRPSETDAIEAPVPGLLAGGPNPGQQDKCPGYPNNLPDESYLDDVCSYASNEIAINWNAPLTYLAFAIEFLSRQKE